MLKHLQERRQDEKGFTLIELMVVVLIMGILMAIAIPTFLSTRSSANDASAKSNATNAYTNEKSYYASNQVFFLATGETGNSLDDTLPWGTTLGTVNAVISSTSAAPTSAVIVVAESTSGDCYYIQDNETSNAAYIGYAETTGATSTAPCAQPTSSFTLLTTAPATGTSASANTTANSLGVPGTWYASW